MYLFSKEKNNVVFFPRQIENDIKFETKLSWFNFLSRPKQTSE